MITVLSKLEVFTKMKSQYEGVNLLNADDDELDEIINSRSEEEPMLYNVIDKTEISKYENTFQFIELFTIKQIWKCMNYT